MAVASSGGDGLGISTSLHGVFEQIITSLEMGLWEQQQDCLSHQCLTQEKGLQSVTTQGTLEIASEPANQFLSMSSTNLLFSVSCVYLYMPYFLWSCWSPMCFSFSRSNSFFTFSTHPHLLPLNHQKMKWNYYTLWTLFICGINLYVLCSEFQSNIGLLV